MCIAYVHSKTYKTRKFGCTIVDRINFLQLEYYYLTEKVHPS